MNTHKNDNGETYYSMQDDYGETVYSFTPDFEDIWNQDDEDLINVTEAINRLSVATCQDRAEIIPDPSWGMGEVNAHFAGMIEDCHRARQSFCDDEDEYPESEHQSRLADIETLRKHYTNS